MSDLFYIRKATADDLPDITRIYNYEVENSVSTFDTAVKTYDEMLCWFNAHTGARIIVVAVASDTDSVIGYGSLSDYRSKDAYISTAELSVYVDISHRGKGVGAALARRVIDCAASDGVTKAIISVITSGNKASIRLHEKLGFTHCGTLKSVGRKFGKLLDIDNYELVL